ncbi:T9SS type A sorting domain-containing protein [bacterium]|nr:T9SS type A sorting domain-containing protein [bacterium]
MIQVNGGAAPDSCKWAAAAAHNGNIYVSGGQDASGENRMDGWRYNFVENTWNPWVNHAPCAGHTMILYLNYLLAFGGMRWNDQDFRDDFRSCDPAKENEFRYIYPKGDVPAGRAFHAAATDGKKCYIFGGKGNLGAFLESHGISIMPDKDFSGGVLKAWPGVGLILLQAAFSDLDMMNKRHMQGSGAEEYAGSIYLFGGMDPDNKAVNSFYRYDIASDSWEDLTDAQDDVESGLPVGFSLSAYPNPFNASVTIRYILSGSAPVKITIYNNFGRVVRIFSDRLQPAGDQHVTWDGRDQHGYALPSGIYICQMKSAGYLQSVKLTLLW